MILSNLSRREAVERISGAHIFAMYHTVDTQLGVLLMWNT